MTERDDLRRERERLRQQIEAEDAGQQANAGADRIASLSALQRELATMGHKLIDKFMQNQQAQPNMVKPEDEGGAE